MNDWLKCFGAVLVAGLLAMADAQAAVTLAAHRAVYDLKLKDASDRSGVENVVGRMVVEVTGAACEGWSINFRLVNRFDLGDGGSRVIDSRSNSWESGDGLTMRYASRQFVDGRLEDETLLKAQKPDPEGSGTGEITKPQPETFDLPPHTVFPVVHQERLVQRALAGEARDQSLVFDGADGKNVFQAISFIGAEKPADPASGEQVAGNAADALARWRGWPVTISYYKTGGAEEGLPEYQVSFFMYENGIAGKLVLDYGDFALDGRLSELDLFDPVTCQ